VIPGAGAVPVEYALAALLSCQVVSYRFWAAALDIPLDEVHVDIEGDLDVRGFLGLDAAVRPGLTGVRLVAWTGSARRQTPTTVDLWTPSTRTALSSTCFGTRHR
jgi:hypothetical protein